MTTIGVAFLTAFGCSVVLTRVVMFLALRLGAVDLPDDFRKLHGRPVPFGGGIPIFVAFAVPTIGLLLFPEVSTISRDVWEHIGRLRLLYTCAAGVLVLGMLDDALDLKPGWKLAGQLVVAVAAYWGGFRISSLSNPFGPPLDLGPLALPVTVLWFLGCMNAVNLLDGLDGLAAGVTVFAGGTLLVVALHFENVLAMFLMASLTGAALGFLMYNFPPARIFLGDGGSLLLGFLIASLSLIGASRKAETAVALFIPVVALGLPIVDTAVAIVRRWYKRLPISSPDRRHIHHLLVAMGYSHRRAVITLYLVTVSLGALAFLITVSRSEVVILLLGTFFVVGFVSVRLFSGVRLRDALEKMHQDRLRREQEMAARLALERATERCARADSLPQMWRICEETLDTFGMEWAKLTLFAEERADYQVFTWEKAGRPMEAGAVWSATLPVSHDGQRLGELVVGRRIGGVGASGEILDLLHQMSTLIAKTLVRLRGKKATGDAPGDKAPEGGR
ncbi:MAG: undecaprenyl/decaprenyl-phosphate alpha-N-acetylglucosaminyl 1-phosphate transferase [Verrucomicrobia bacterium]|nr:MAG: undecaprenyl/decaprenyl-phosphate alpha-N-acetylglucosaminyl 1-phosphate transferase [Verrucomicrobiota bacterium]